MKRKRFIQLSSFATAGGLVLPWSCNPRKQNPQQIRSVQKNWAGNYTYTAPHFHEPSSLEEVQELVRNLDEQKALGSAHCFNDIADSPSNQISTRRLNRLVEVDKENKTVTVEAGTRYGDFAEALHEQGYALKNLASLPHISVAGACATATHGSGVRNGGLATQVVAVELVKPDGSLVTIDRSHPDFPAVVVGLGAFGIITKVSLEIEETYDVLQHVFLDLPFDVAVTQFDEIMSSGYSVSYFTNWMDNKVSEVWVKRRADDAGTELGGDFYGAKAATHNVHPVIEQSAESCSEQMGVPGPWYDRLPHFKMGFTPSTGAELQAEYFVPRENAADALMAFEKMKEEIFPHMFISEIRTVAADNFWMSPCYKKECVALHTTWKPKPKEVYALLPKIEAELAPYGVKPHWGKLFTLDAKVLQGRYEKHPEFLALAKAYDPDGKFKNGYLTRNIY
ncbi:MAG: FAD-binding protein [Bacteroidia bacterium]|nr:FAD-binding protein [Bacteroidia bacterium]